MNYVVREMMATDCVAVAALSGDLGYETKSTDVEARLSLVSSRPDNGIFVATCDDAVVAWCHVLGIRLIETDGYAEIGGIVVVLHLQRQGIGSQLIAAAERWAAAAGYSRLRLRSGVHREQAHQFYEAIGYAKSKASYAFEKRLIPVT